GPSNGTDPSGLRFEPKFRDFFIVTPIAEIVYTVTYVMPSEWYRDRQLHDRQNEVDLKRRDKQDLVKLAGDINGPWNASTGCSAASGVNALYDPTLYRNLNQAVGDITVLGTVSVFWTSSGPVFVSASGRFVFQGGVYRNVATGKAA